MHIRVLAVNTKGSSLASLSSTWRLLGSLLLGGPPGQCLSELVLLSGAVKEGCSSGRRGWAWRSELGAVGLLEGRGRLKDGFWGACVSPGLGGAGVQIRCPSVRGGLGDSGADLLFGGLQEGRSRRQLDGDVDVFVPAGACRRLFIAWRPRRLNGVFFLPGAETGKNHL